jgi:hypothetical protein
MSFVVQAQLGHFNWNLQSLQALYIRRQMEILELLERLYSTSLKFNQPYFPGEIRTMNIDVSIMSTMSSSSNSP